MVDVIEFGDCRDIMRNWIELGVKVHTCVTSPPYFWLAQGWVMWCLTLSWVAEPPRLWQNGLVAIIWDVN